jgi:hypothetical protein
MTSRGVQVPQHAARVRRLAIGDAPLEWLEDLHGVAAGVFNEDLSAAVPVTISLRKVAFAARSFPTVLSMSSTESWKRFQPPGLGEFWPAPPAPG